MNTILLIILLLIIFGWGLPSILSSFYGAPWLPTPKKTIHKMLNLARLKKGEVVYDLGSGFGRILIIATKEYGARSVGIEIDPIKHFLSKIIAKVFGANNNIEFIRGNLFNQDLSSADVVVCYLLQPTNKKIMKKLEKELKPGTRIVSHSFTFPGWKVIKNEKKGSIFLYISGKSFGA